jgi:hypothetical protein
LKTQVYILVRQNAADQTAWHPPAGVIQAAPPHAVDEMSRLCRIAGNPCSDVARTCHRNCPAA